MDNLDAQSEEIIALQSIYEESLIIENMNPRSGRFNANVSLPHPFYIVCKRDDLQSHCKVSEDTEDAFEEFEIDHLPPISLLFEFPITYPSQTCPAFFLSCCWLSLEQLSALCQRLESLWVEGCGEVVLFNWIHFLEDEALEFLHISNHLDITELIDFQLKACLLEISSFDHNSVSGNKCETQYVDKETRDHELKSGTNKKHSGKFKSSVMSIRPSISAGLGPKDCRAFLDLPDGKYLKAKLKDYDEFKKQEIFQVSWHLCTICFTEKKGSDFATFRACHHSFCRDCLKSYFEIQIKDGSVHSLNCPHEKCTSVADGVLVKLIVDKDSFMKYDALLLSRTLESMTDIAYCPRSICQCPLLIDPGDRMGICPACNFVFCPFCKMAYHGVAPCNLRSEKKQQICNEYMKGDAAMKETLEKRHGKRVLQTLVENSLSEKWLNSNSKNCPHCNASIEKTEGCNKMTCFRCGIFFCWLCLRQLKASNPYSHYSEKGSECFDKLFPEDDDAFDNLDDEWDVEPGEFLDLV